MKWTRLALMAASTLTTVACGTTSEQPPSIVTATSAASVTSATPAAKPASYVTLPDTYGQNAATVKKTLEDLGLTKVELASSNTKHSTVSEPKDWKVVGMVPGAGSVVKSDVPVILKVVKVQ